MKKVKTKIRKTQIKELKEALNKWFWKSVKKNLSDVKLESIKFELLPEGYNDTDREEVFNVTVLKKSIKR